MEKRGRVSIVLARGHFGPPLSRVLTQVRRSGPVIREDILRTTGLSASTVARALTTLTEVGLVRERAELVADGAIGRPSIPMDLDCDHYVTIGCHVGLRTTGGTQGVGNSTKLAVVASSVAVIAVDFMVTKLLIVLLY